MHINRCQPLLPALFGATRVAYFSIINCASGDLLAQEQVTAQRKEKVGKARDLTQQSVESAIHADSKETGAISSENAAIWEAEFGNAARARQAAADGLKLFPTSQGVEVEAALAYAMAGDTARAESLAQDLNKRYQLDTQVQSLWLPAIRAQLALNRKDAATAINNLQPALPRIEHGQIQFVVNLSCLCPTYIRGKAYLTAGQGTQAAAEFHKFSTTAASSGTVGREPWRIWVLRVRTRCSGEPRRARMPTLPASVRLPLTKTSSPSGKTPTPTSTS